MGIRKRFNKDLAAIALVAGLSSWGCETQDVLQRLPSELYRPHKLGIRIIGEPAKPNNRPDKYAVLINGSDESRFVAEISLIYQVLLENGFRRENVYILDQRGSEDFLYPADDIASRKNLESVFLHLSKKVDSEDLLVVHISDHGVRNKTEDGQEITEIYLPSGNVSEIDLEGYLSNIKPKYGIITTEICYGGGLALRLGKGRYIGISQTTDKDLGYSSLRDSFGGFFYQAFRNHAMSDRNGDDLVTIDEAFAYAKENHSWSKRRIVHPQLVSELDVKDISIK